MGIEVQDIKKLIPNIRRGVRIFATAQDLYPLTMGDFKTEEELQGYLTHVVSSGGFSPQGLSRLEDIFSKYNDEEIKAIITEQYTEGGAYAYLNVLPERNEFSVVEAFFEDLWHKELN